MPSNLQAVLKGAEYTVLNLHDAEGELAHVIKVTKVGGSATTVGNWWYDSEWRLHRLNGPAIDTPHQKAWFSHGEKQDKR